jgi:EAL domain-containing protein (putative c-di-GMP-specific phosphodiesterase class I)
MVERLPIEVGASVGVAVAPEHGRQLEELLRRVDMAVQTAKQQGGGLVVYSTACDPYDPDRLALLGELRNALEATQQLALHYQPKVTLADRRVVGAEALLRWRHPKRGNIPPNRFIPVAEQAGLIRPLTRWVLGTALQQGRSWYARGRLLPVAVNLSARSLHDPGLVDEIAGALDANGLPPELLLLEITESAVMVDPARAAETLRQLHERGVGVSIDDFGTGYSSLGYLRSLPVTELKIDRTFVSGMGAEGGADRAIVRSTSELGHNLGLRVVAEGVEDETTFELLAAIGCDLAQGYWIGRPMPAAEFDTWLDTGEWRLASA